MGEGVDEGDAVDGDSAARSDRSPAVDSAEGLEGFSRATQTWFQGTFEAPTATQVGAWETIRRGDNVLVVAPTGSGKTLAAFLWAVDRLATRHEDPDRGPESGGDQEVSGGEDSKTDKPGVRVLYISPLKALGVDVERNLAAPLAGIRQGAIALGEDVADLKVGVRSGDTPPAERRRLVAKPPDILITTPESLYLLLTSQAAETLKTVDTVIVDEVHALAGNKRGAHLALSLERLDALLEKPAQRIGLSATVEPAEEVARFLGGAAPVTIVDPHVHKHFDVTVEVPVEDMTNPPPPDDPFVTGDSGPNDHRLGSMWPSIERSLYERVVGARSTIVFTNSRRLAERLTAALNKLHAQSAGEDAAPLARSHHGSVSKEARAEVEEALKSGELRCVVATSSLELGIDMGNVDLVIQVDPPPSVSSGLQRLGRSGHQVGAASKAVFYPTHRSKLVETAAIVSRMNAGQIEPMRVLSNPLDVLAQQTIAAAAAAPLQVEEWLQTVRRAAPFQSLPQSAFLGVLDLISGHYPSTEFSHLRARVDWDRQAGILEARPGAKRLAVTSGGTIPDRGLYRVVTATGDGGGTRVGELDEEMVYETRVGEVFTLGTTPWRVRNITKDSVEVEPAFGSVGKVPFWRGDSPSRPYTLGVGLGDLATDLANKPEAEALADLAAMGFTENAATNTLTYLAEQVEHVGRVPSATTLVVERTRDDVGDWQYILQSPLGFSVHGPWALAINARLVEQWGVETRAVPSNDGIIVRLPDMDLDGQAPTAADIFLFEAGEVEDIIHREVENSALFAARFREVAARALILGSSLPGKRSPLWQQRLRASALLEVASRYPDFPMILETMREVLQDVYDTKALTSVMADLSSGRSHLVEVTTTTPSPFARSLLFGYVGEFVYEGDTPRGERRLAALSVDPTVLRELLGEVPMKDLLEARAIEEVESELQRTKAGWGARSPQGVLDLLRALGPLTEAELGVRVDEEALPEDTTALDMVAAWMEDLVSSRQAYEVRIDGIPYLAAMEDAGLLAEIGVPPPPGVPAAFLRVEGSALRDLLLRFAVTHGPFTLGEVSARFGLAPQEARHALSGLVDEGVLSQGRFLPDELRAGRALADEPEWVSQKVLSRLRSRSLALLRGEVEPVPGPVFAQFLGRWQHCGGALRGVDGTYLALETLAGVPLPASTWETLVLPQRVADYEPEFLDTLVAGGEIEWVGSAPIGSSDGWVAFYPTGTAPRGMAQEESERVLTPLQQDIVEVLSTKGALFAPAIHAALKTEGITAKRLSEAMWDLVWMGKVTGDTVASLRAKTAGRRAAQKTRHRRPRARTWGRSVGGARRSNLGGRPGQAGSGLLDLEPSLAGRWSLVEDGPEFEGTKAQQDLDRQATTWVGRMLERFGVLTRGSVVAEGLPGGFAAAYRLLTDFEVAGACQRGYFVEGLGGAQFAIEGAVDYLRDVREEAEKTTDKSDESTLEANASTLAVTDPANPYGAALEWPEPEGEGTAIPKRAAGALVTLVGGKPVFYLERGGKTALTFDNVSEAERRVAARSLVNTVQRAYLATFTIQKISGQEMSGGIAAESRWTEPLLAAGFERVPRGLVLRRKIR